MGRRDKKRQIANLFHQTDSAYYYYEQKVLGGNRDVQWPEWCAEYMIGHGLDLLLDDRIAAEVLAGFLLRSKADYKAYHSDLTWEEFATARIVERIL